MMTMRHSEFKNKIIVITGGTGAIGKEIAKKFIEEESIVIILGRNLKNIEDLNQHKNLFFMYLDLFEKDQIKETIVNIIKKYNKIDILINCAGGGARNNIAPLHLQEEKIINEILYSNLESTMLITKYTINSMIENKYGKIINFSSVVGIKGQKNYSEYSAAKSGIIGFTKSLAIELAPYNINVNSIAPGYIPRKEKLTEQNEKFYKNKNLLNTIPTCEKIADVVLFLCKEQANFITGENITIDGGYLLK